MRKIMKMPALLIGFYLFHLYFFWNHFENIKNVDVGSWDLIFIKEAK